MLGFDKVTAAYDLLKKGNAVSDPAKWKKRQITTTAIVALIWSGLRALESFTGIQVPVDDETVNNVSIGVLALVNWIFTLTTTEKIGIGEK